MTIALTQKEKRLLQFLIERTWPLGIDEMVRLTGASKRTVYYSLNNLRCLFRQFEVGELRQETDGFLLDEVQRKALRVYLSEKTTLMDKKERISYIICAAICADWQLRFKTLENKFNLSRNAVFADLADAKNELADCHLNLKNSKKEGYYVEGDMLLMRTVFQQHISRLLESSGKEQLDIFEPESIDTYEKKISQINDRLKLGLGSTVQLELVYLMQMIHKKPNCTPVSLMDAEFIHKTKEWQAADELFADLPEQEKNYLTVCLMNFSNGSTFAGEWEEDLDLWECTRKLIELFEIMACVSFEKK